MNAPSKIVALSPAEELTTRIRGHLGQRSRYALRQLLSRYNFADVAEVLDHRLDLEEAVQCFQHLATAQAAKVLPDLSQERQVACLLPLTHAKSSRVFRAMAADDAVDILQELSPELRRHILGQMPFDTDTRTLHQLLMEEPDTAAGIMSTEYIALSVEETVGAAMARVRQAEEKAFIYYGYLVNAQQKLVGVVSLKTLLHHSDETPLNQIATFDVKSILVSYDQELVLDLFRKYNNLLAVPVVDHEEVLRGLITLDDVMDVLDEETSDDIYQASGITIPEEMDEKNLLSGPVLNAVKARLPWLSISVAGQLVSALVIAHYQKTVAAAVIAFSFMPLLCGLAGNMGTQSDTIAVRGLSLKLLRDENVMDTLFREIRVALVTGGFFALVVGSISYLLYHHVEMTLLLMVSIIASVLISASLGILLPYSYQKHFKQDPAGVGGPFITTMVDVCTYLFYLTVLTLLIDRMI